MVTKSIRCSLSPDSARLLCQRRNIPQKPFRALRVPDLTVKEEREYWAALMGLLDGSNNRNDTTRELVDGTRRRLEPLLYHYGCWSDRAEPSEKPNIRATL